MFKNTFLFNKTYILDMYNIIIIRMNTSGKKGHSVILDFLDEVTNDGDEVKSKTLLLMFSMELYVILW